MSSPAKGAARAAPRHSIEISEEAGVRFLHFGSEWVQGAMRVARPYALELEYTREMMACLLLRGENDWPKRVLQVGLGAASLTRFLHRYRPETKQTIIELNPAVMAMARQSFKLPIDDARVDVRIDDGVAWMREDRRDKFDCIMVDGYDHNARFGALGTEAFYRDCRKHLSRQGLLVLNLFGRTHGYKRQIENLSAAFDGRVLALSPIDEDNHGGNAIVFAAVGERIALDMLSLRGEAARLHDETGIKLAGTLVRLDQAIAALSHRADSSSRKRGGVPLL
ncbi:MAG: fused MFS/spermidine synthase [Betaproteobacteria bacterium]|nr:fused MFS/spermidine synthase [Betaproteobacteria bacterium]